MATAPRSARNPYQLNQAQFDGRDRALEQQRDHGRSVLDGLHGPDPVVRRRRRRHRTTWQLQVALLKAEGRRSRASFRRRLDRLVGHVDDHEGGSHTELHVLWMDHMMSAEANARPRRGSARHREREAWPRRDAVDGPLRAHPRRGRGLLSKVWYWSTLTDCADGRSDDLQDQDDWVEAWTRAHTGRRSALVEGSPNSGSPRD